MFQDAEHYKIVGASVSNYVTNLLAYTQCAFALKAVYAALSVMRIHQLRLELLS